MDTRLRGHLRRRGRGRKKSVLPLEALRRMFETSALGQKRTYPSCFDPQPLLVKLHSNAFVK